jgi:hypothetical protein
MISQVIANPTTICGHSAENKEERYNKHLILI